MNKVEFLETTLRDGSYAVDFRFTVKDTANLCAALEQAGLGLIEIGHGLGLHGKESGKGDAAATDAEYLSAAASVLKKAKFWETHAKTMFNDRHISVLNRLLDGFDGKLSTSKWAKMTKCSQDTALRDIQDLIHKDVLKQEPSGGRSTRYFLAD